LSNIGIVDLTFGAAGLNEGADQDHLQRVNMELHGATAKHVIAYYHLRRIINLRYERRRIARMASA